MSTPPTLSFTSILVNLLTFFVLFSVVSRASVVVPPLQWIRLTELLEGSSPPPRAYSAIGYDESSRTLIIFGGEQNGQPLQDTYLLNLSSLTWSTPTPPTAPVGINQLPPARSATICGNDFAASYRHGFVVVGGEGSGQECLSDAWEYDFQQQFWSEINMSPGSIALCGASGGADASVPDPQNPNLNTTFYVGGGSTGNGDQSPNVYEINISGVQSSNNVGSLFASFQQVTFPSLPSVNRQGSTVMPGGNIVFYGGCNETTQGIDCAGQMGYTLDISSSREIAANICPAPRVGASLVPNRNTLASSYATQAFLLLGLFNTTLWTDGGASGEGEVSVLDTQTGSWTRVIPSGDPGSNSNSGTVTYPTPREGGAALSYPLALVGEARTTSSDTIVFGGRDVNGTYLNDVWLLRAYAGMVESNGSLWTGYGNGQLQTGVDASGAGVTVQFLTSCVSANAQPSTSSASSTSGSSIISSPQPTSSSSNSSPNSSSSSPDSTMSLPDASIYHKTLSPLSVALVFPVLVLQRALSTEHFTFSLNWGVWFWLSVLPFLAAYALGIAGFATAFLPSSTSTTSLLRRALSTASMQTGHAKAGIIFFVAMYGCLPIIFIIILLFRIRSRQISHSIAEGDAGKVSSGTSVAGLALNEKHDISSESHRHDATLTESSLNRVTPAATRQRTHSWGSTHIWPMNRSRDRNGRQSSESGLESNEGTAKGFEVLNRNPRARRTSSNGLIPSAMDHRSSTSRLPRSLSDLSWLDRRRSVNAVGELDYVLSQISRPSQEDPMNVEADRPSTGPLLALNAYSKYIPEFPSNIECFVHISTHLLLLGISIVSLVELWFRAPIAAFVVFLAWICIFYSLMVILAWRGKPRISVLSVFVYRLRGGPNIHEPIPTNSPPPSRPHSMADVLSSAESRSPYTFHQPLYHRALSSPNEDDYMSLNQHATSNTEDLGDDYDEEDEQRRIEQELDRREVNIVTVPRRKLRVTNPS